MLDIVNQVLVMLHLAKELDNTLATKYQPFLIDFEKQIPDNINFSEYVNRIKSNQEVIPATVFLNGKFIPIKSKEDLVKSFLVFNPTLKKQLLPPEEIIMNNCDASVYGINSSEGNTGSTATGPFDPWNSMEAAVRLGDFYNYKLQTLSVRNLNNGKVVKVKITDNGGLPHACIDLQALPAQIIGIPHTYPGGPGSTVPVEVFREGKELTTDQKLEILFKNFK